MPCIKVSNILGGPNIRYIPGISNRMVGMRCEEKILPPWPTKTLGPRPTAVPSSPAGAASSPVGTHGRQSHLVLYQILSCDFLGRFFSRLFRIFFIFNFVRLLPFSLTYLGIVGVLAAKGATFLRFRLLYWLG